MPFNLKKYNIRSFWHFQILGFSIYWASDFLQMFLSYSYTFTQSWAIILQTPAIFILTALLRLVYKRIDYRSHSIHILLLKLVFWSFICTFLWQLIIVFVLYQVFFPQQIEYFTLLKNFLWWLFVLFEFPFGWSILYFGIKYWLDWDIEKKRSEKAKLKARQMLLQMLRYQLNPHFLFNALNSIRALIDEDKQTARLMVTELSEFLRYSLLGRDIHYVTLLEEINAIKRYLSIEKKRFEEKLEINYSIEPAIEDFPILIFLIHPLIENSLKYGLQTSPIPLIISIEAKPGPLGLKIIISNTGKWINESDKKIKENGTGTGLENIKARLDNIYQANYKFSHFEKDGKVYFEIEIPKIQDIGKNDSSQLKHN